MAPRANWEGLFTAVACDMSDRAVSCDLGVREDQFQPDLKKTGHRIRYLKVDADTPVTKSPGDEVTGDEVPTRTSSRAIRSMPIRSPQARDKGPGCPLG